MELKGVIFDVDGTLLNTTEGVLESAAFAANAMGYPELPYKTMLNFVGPPIQSSFMQYYGCDEKAAQQAADLFRGYYKEKALFKAVPYQGIFELCDKVKKLGLKTSVATYKREDYALMVLKHFGFDKYCDIIHGADNDNRLSKSDIVNICINEMCVSKESCVLIGDSKYDAIGAKQSGVKFIAVTYGFGFKSESDANEYPSIAVCNSPKEVENYLSSF